jgi:hypothetical protein
MRLRQLVRDPWPARRLVQGARPWYPSVRMSSPGTTTPPSARPLVAALRHVPERLPSVPFLVAQQSLGETPMMTDWADGLTTIALRWRTGSQSIREMFEESAPPEDAGSDALRAAIADRLRQNPPLVDAWQTYSYDKRGTPSPYMDGSEVGFFDGQREDVTVHPTSTDACVDFLYRETQWVLHRRRSS